MVDKFIQIQTTVENMDDAENIATVLITRKLAACVQIFGPSTSIYFWANQKTTAKEYMCLIKSKSANFKKIEKLLKDIHPYKVPEIIVIPIQNGSKEYLSWMKEQIK